MSQPPKTCEFPLTKGDEENDPRESVALSNEVDSSCTDHLRARRKREMSQQQEIRRLSVAFPASVISDVPHLREKTGKLGAIARACSIFGVDEVLLYADDAARDQRADLQLCVEILRFIETPQYLRKRLFRLSSNLKFTGVLPPLHTPPHDAPRRFADCKVGDVRDGVVVSNQRGRLMIDVGVEEQFECDGDLPAGTRATFRIVRLGKDPRCEVVDRSTISGYWGYRVSQVKSPLPALIGEGNFDLKIGTSRYGASIREAWSSIANAMKGARSILLAFGSPRMGLREILKLEGRSPEDLFDYFVNTAPDQNVSTVRTEEALLLSLGVLNLIRLGEPA